MYQAKIPPLSPYTYQERGKQLKRPCYWFQKQVLTANLCRLSLNMSFQMIKAPLCRAFLASLLVVVKKPNTLSLSAHHRLFFCVLTSFLPTLHPLSLPIPLHLLLFFLTLSLCPAYNSEDQLLWRPGELPVQEVEDFLLNAQRPHGQEGSAYTQTQGDTVRDNEQVLVQ